MKFANYTIFEKDFRLYGLEYAIEHTKKLGLEAVEFICLPRVKKHIFESVGEAKRARELLEKAGLSVSCYSMYADLLSESWEEHLALTLHNVDCAAELGSPYFHHTLIPYPNYPSPRPSFDEAFSAVFEKAERIAEHCEKYGINCLYEPQGLYMNGVEGLTRLLSEMKKRHSNVGICGDFANSLFVDTPPEDIFIAFASDIKHIHVKDCVVSEPDGTECRYRSTGGKYIRDALPGEGCVDFAKLFSIVKGYDGDISLEFSATDEQTLRSLEYIKSFL